MSVRPKPPDAFMALELALGALEPARGIARYHPAFGS
jgi:predicted N-acetyltransferase YhbS